MNQEQYERMVAVIQSEPMLCEGSWAREWEQLRGSDHQFYVDHIDGNVKIELPANVNCAMGALIDDLNESGAFNYQPGPLDDASLAKHFGITPAEQEEIIRANDRNPVERRKQKVIEKIAEIRQRYVAQGVA